MTKSFGLVAMLMILTISLPVVTVAQESNEGELEEVTTTNSIDEEVIDNEKAKSRQKRLEDYKERAQEALSKSQERKVAGACKGAQTKLSSIQSNLNTVIENRQNRYENVLSNLGNLINKLQAAGVDTTEIELAVTSINGISTTVVTKIELYQLVLSDIAEMDCEEDPVAFKSALKAAREYRTDAFNNSKSMKSYVNDTLKPRLQTIKELLITNDNGSEEG